MSTVAFTSLYSIIAPYAKRCPQPAMDTAIREAAREFCYRTKFRRISDVQDVNALQRNYSPTNLSADEEALEIQAAQYSNGNGYTWPLSPCQPEQLPNPLPYPSCNTQPQGFWLDIPSQIAIWPLPQSSVALGLAVRWILQPTETASTLDVSLYQFANRAIAWGALSRLLTRDDEPWTNVNLANECEAKFQRGINKALTDVGFGFQQGNQVTATYRY